MSEAATPQPASTAALSIKRPARGPRFVGGLPGPVFAKDVWILGKRPSTGWIRLIYSLFLLAIVALTFFVAMDGDRYTPYGSQGIAARLQSSQGVAPTVTIAIIWSQFVMLTIIGAALGAPAISDELRAGSLATLLTTPLKATQIILGKLLSRMVELAILTLIPLPLMLALRSFGGVPAPNVLTMVGLCLTVGMLAVQIGIFFSIRFKRAAAPLVMTVLVLALMVMALPGILAALGQWPALQPFQGQLQTAGAILSPPWMLMMNTATLMNEGGFRGMGNLTALSLASIGATLAWWFIFFVLSCFMLRRVMRTEDRVKTSAVALQAPTTSSSSATPAPQATATTEPPARRRKRRAWGVQAGSSRAVSDAPVLWREMQQPILGRKWMAWTLGVIITLALLFVYYMSGLDGIQIGVAIVGVIVWLLFAAVTTTASISQEREGRTLDVLLTTPIAGRDIVWGKFMGGLRKLWIGPAVILLHLVISGCFSNVTRFFLEPIDTLTEINRWRGVWTPDYVHPVVLILMPIILLGPIAFLAASGVWLSTITKRSTTASICNLAIALVIWLVIPIFLAIFTSGFMRGGSEELVTLWLMPNPVMLTASAIDGSDESFRMLGEGFKFEGPEHFDVGFLGFLFAVCAFCGMYLFAAMFFLRSAARRIAAGTGRSA